MILNRDTNPKMSRLVAGIVRVSGTASVQRRIASTALPRWRVRLALAAVCGASLLCGGLAIGEATEEPATAAPQTGTGAAKQNPRNAAREEEAKPIKSGPAMRIPSLEPYPLPSKARQALVELAGKSDILILGEIHGTQEVPAIAVALLESLAKQGYRALALEIPSDQQVRSINVVPHSGGHFGVTESDDGKTSVGVQTIRSMRRIDDAEVQALDKQWWDWELNLPRATPATFLTPPKNPVDAEP